MTRSGPQGLTPPDTMMSRVDGWIGSPGHIPPGVAEVIVGAMPSLVDDVVADVQARMQARQRMYEQLRGLRHD